MSGPAHDGGSGPSVPAGKNPRDPRWARWLPVACAVALLALASAGLHGFSLPAWHEILDGSPPDELLLGSAREIRSDDWTVALPLALSQSASVPRFPATSELIAYGGVDMRVGYPVPVAGWISLFRPQVWGYFVGPDFGLAWHWWFRILALFVASFLAFRLLARGDPRLALAAAIAFAGAPFFQFWSYNVEPLGAAALLGFVALAGIARARTRLRIAGSAALLAASAACFALSFPYPPYQVGLAYVVAATTVAYLVREGRVTGGPLGPWARTGVALAALAVAALAVAAFFVQSSEAIAIVAASEYPGRRRSTGGDLSVLHLLNHFVTTPVGARALAAFRNVSEAGSFFFLSPPLVAASLGTSLALRRRPDPVVVALAACIALLTVYATLGFPEPIARLLFAGRLPGFRAVVAVGLADIALLVAVASRPPPLSRAASWALAGGWAAIVGAVGLRIAATVPSVPASVAAAAAVAVLLVGVGVLRGRTSAVAALALASVLAGAWFNPLVRGGSRYLRDNELSRTILELDRAAGGSTRWIAFDDARLANLFRALGVRSVNGLHPYPQRELWSRLGLPERTFADWNRYAHVTFLFADSKREAGLLLGGPDSLGVKIHPDHPAFARLDVDFLVWVGDDRARLDGARSLEWVRSVGNRHLYRVRRPAPGHS